MFILTLFMYTTSLFSTSILPLCLLQLHTLFKSTISLIMYVPFIMLDCLIPDSIPLSPLNSYMPLLESPPVPSDLSLTPS